MMKPMHTDPTATPGVSEIRPEGTARKPTPIGLIGLTLVDAGTHADLPRLAPPPRRWRYAKYVMAVVAPIGVAFAAHRISEPEGLDAAEAAPASAIDFVNASEAAGSAPAALRPPARSFAATAFGHSNAVRVRVVLPNEPVVLPMTFTSATDGLQTQWIGFDGKPNESPSPWPSNAQLRAPSRPGAFWLVLSRGGVADTVADIALFVEHPMPNARATGINGYHFGRWPKSADGAIPRGFIEVTERISDFPLSPHLKLSDFVVHDAQAGFPKYLHVREPLLDKIELTVAEIAKMRGRSASTVTLHVASGFRSPAHNSGLSGSAQDSRHMYGDAADIAIDANNDGQLTEIDARLVASAAEAVERKYPDLVGGIGLYITRDGGGWPYVHIDVRGTRARWRGGVRKGAVTDSLLPAGATFDSVAAAVTASSPVPTEASVAPAESLVPARATTVAPKRAKPSTRSTRPTRATRASAGSAAAFSRAVPGARPSPTANSERTVDDPFASAAKKFRSARP